MWPGAVRGARARCVACRGPRGRARAQTSCPAAGLVSARAGVGYDLCDESLSLLSRLGSTKMKWTPPVVTVPDALRKALSSPSRPCTGRGHVSPEFVRLPQPRLRLKPHLRPPASRVFRRVCLHSSACQASPPQSSPSPCASVGGSFPWRRRDAPAKNKFSAARACAYPEPLNACLARHAPPGHMHAQI